MTVYAHATISRTPAIAATYVNDAWPVAANAIPSTYSRDVPQSPKSIGPAWYQDSSRGRLPNDSIDGSCVGTEPGPDVARSRALGRRAAPAPRGTGLYGFTRR